MAKKQSTVELEDGREITIEHPEEWSENRIKAFALSNVPPKYKDAVTDETDPVTTQDLLLAGVMDAATGLVPDIFFGDNLMATPDEVLAERESFIRDSLGIPSDYEMTTGDLITRALGDPMTYVGVGRTGAKTAVGKILGTGGQLGEAVATTAAGVSGAEAARGATGIPYIDDYLSTVAGSVAGTGAAMGSSVLRTTTGAPLRMGEEAYAAKKPDSESVIKQTNAASEYIAEKRIQAQLNTLKETVDPIEISKAIDDIEAVKETVPNLQLEGIAGVLYDNPAVQSWVRNVAQHDPEFVANFRKQADNNLEVLVDSLGEITGLAGRVDETDLYNVADTIYRKEIDKLTIKFEKDTEKLDESIAKLNARLSAKSPDVVGSMVKTLVDDVESGLKERVNVLYDASKVAGRGIDLPSRYVENLANLASGLRNVDPFGEESATARKLRQNWSPLKELRDIDGVEVDVTTLPVVKLQELASLKKAINQDLKIQTRLKKQGNEKAPSRVQKLTQLKRQVDGVVSELENIPKTRSFAKKLKKADKFYYEKLGLPLSSEGMRTINAAKFNKDAARHLTDDTQKAQEFLNFVGERQGRAILKHALRMKAESNIFTNGEINQQKLRNFLANKTNQELIQLAKMEQEFSNINRTANTILDTKVRHKKAYDEKIREVSNGFFKTILNKNLPAAVREMLSNPKRRKQLIAEVNKLNKAEREMMMAGIRNAYITEGMLRSQKTMSEYLTENRAATVDIFGEDYISNLDKFGVAHDTIVNIDKALQKTLGADPIFDTLQQYAGISSAELIGLARNQILSTPRKFINAGSKIFLEKGKRRYYKKSAEVLQDPDVLRQLANPPEGTLSKTKEVLKALKAGKKATAEIWEGTVLPYYIDVLNAAGIFSQLRVSTAVEKSLENEIVENQ